MTSSSNPIEVLPDAALLQILKFVGAPNAGLEATNNEVPDTEENETNETEENVELISLATAGKLYFSLASVSNGWKKMMDRLITNPAFCCVRVDVNEFNTEQLPRALSWLCDKKPCVGSLVSTKEALLNQSTLLIKVLLDCHTKELTEARIPIFAFSREDHNNTVELQRIFQGILAMQCPKLKDLHLEVSFEALEEWNMDSASDKEHPALSPVLFSLSSIKNVSFSSCPTIMDSPLSVDPMFFTNMIKNWGSLESLSLEYGTKELLVFAPSGSQNPSLSIESNSLKKLSLVNFFPWHRTVFALDCPNLQVCSCFQSSMNFGFSGPPLWRLQVNSAQLPQECRLVHSTPKKIQVLPQGAGSFWMEHHAAGTRPMWYSPPCRSFGNHSPVEPMTLEGLGQLVEAADWP